MDAGRKECDNIHFTMYKTENHEHYNAKCNFLVSLCSLKLYLIVSYIQNMLLIYTI